MSQNYECVVLLDPSLADDAVQGYMDQFSTILTNAGGEVTHTQMWGKRSLSYPINRKKDAYYFLLCFKMEAGAGPVIEEFERQVRINDNILREMTVKVDKLRIADPPPAKVMLGRAAMRPTTRPGAPRFPSRGPAAPAESDDLDEDDIDVSNDDASEDYVEPEADEAPEPENAE